MEWLDKLLLSPERRHAKKVEEEKNEGVTGNYKRRYKFTYAYKHFVAPDIFIDNTINGIFDCGLLYTKTDGTSLWSTEFRNLDFDWGANALPEKYFLFAFCNRMNMQINAEGRIIGGGTWIDLHERWHKRYKKLLFEHISDHDQAQDLYNTCMELGQADAMQMLASNPLVEALGAITSLNYRLNNPNLVQNEYGEIFMAEKVKENYFYPEIDLPLKTMWLHQPVEGEDKEFYIRIGGLNKEKYQEEKWRDIMRTLTDKPNLYMPVYAELSDIYQVDKVSPTQRLLRAATMELMTITKDVWTRQEILAVTMDEKGVVYG